MRLMNMASIMKRMVIQLLPLSNTKFGGNAVLSFGEKDLLLLISNVSIRALYVAMRKLITWNPDVGTPLPLPIG